MPTEYLIWLVESRSRLIEKVKKELARRSNQEYPPLGEEPFNLPEAQMLKVWNMETV